MLRCQYTRRRDRQRSRRKGGTGPCANGARSGPSNRPPAYAAIDLGTNNCRMLIAEPADDGFNVIDGFSRIVRLGEGLGTDGRLADAAMDRTVEALKICANKIRRHAVTEARCIATAACRRADNGADFIDRARRETGLDFETITADREAELTLEGCIPLLRSGHRHALLFDIGGGSTEVLWIATEATQSPRLLGVLSLPLGVVTLAETYGAGAMAEDTYDQIIRHIDEELRPFCREHRIRDAINAGDVQMLGTSGTVTTLGAIYLGLPRYDRSRVDGLSIRFDSALAISARLSGLDCRAREAVPCIGPERADLMPMGCAILGAICRRWPVGTLKAADRGIREGLLMAMITGRGTSTATA